MDEFVNETLTQALEKPKASKEGMIVAYSSLIIMALLPIYYGSFRSVKYIKKQKESGEKLESMSHKDAAMFPIIASCALFGLYIFFKIFSKEYVNLLLAVYFFGLGVFAMTHIISPKLGKLLPNSLDVEHNIIHTKTVRGQKEELINFKFSSKDLVALVISLIIGGIYLWSKHWVVNNLFGLAFALNGVEILHVNSPVIGCTLLAGLFVYDVFWVFGTDVMVTVAKSFEAPIKLVFPQDIFANMFETNNFAMLGLGDVVIPGIFIAMLLRFDISLKKNSYLYFYSSFIAYFVGLVVTITIMSYFKHAQPALLYLVPACIGTPIVIAFLKGELGTLFKYEDHPAEEEADEGGTDVLPNSGEGEEVPAAASSDEGKKVK